MGGKGRGGRRPGAGRPPIGASRLLPVTVSLTPEQVAYLRDIGTHRGGVSAALRWVLDEWCESGGQVDD